MTELSLGKKTIAIGSLLLATAIWGSSFSIMKSVFSVFTPIWFISIRFAIAAVILALLCVNRLKKIDKNLLRDGLIASIPLSFGYAVQNIGLIYTTAANNAFITCTYVVLVPFVVWLFNKRIRAANFLIGFITLIGLAVLSLDKNFSFAVGDIWTLGCALLFAVHITLLGIYSPRYDTLLLSLIQFIIVAIINALLALFIEPLPLAQNFSSQVIWALLYCALFPTILCYFIQISAQKIISTVTVSVLLMSEAIFGAFFGWLLLDEFFTPRQFLGAAILIVCMVATVLIDYYYPQSQDNAETRAEDHCEQSP